MGRELAPHFTQRFLAQITAEQTMAQDGETDWIYTIGDYQREGFFRDIPFNPREPFRTKDGTLKTLGGLEVFLAAQIKEQLKDKPADRPVVVLDIGGGIGSSWSRLAAYFEAEVEAGDVAVVVSNFSNRPQDYDAERRLDGNVHYVQAAFPQIGERAIHLPDGRTVPLRGNVDIMSEHLSLTAWTRIPEWDIPETASILSPHSVYISRTVDATVPQNPRLPYEKEDRTLGVRLAHERLQTHHGLNRINAIEAGTFRGEAMNYNVFRAQQAPLITLSRKERLLRAS